MVEAAPSSPFEMPEPQGRADLSIAKLRTRRPAHICETSRYRAVFERPSYVTRWRRTDWLGRRDSNLCILDCNSPKTPSQGISPLASGIPCVCCRGRITRFDRRRTARPHATSAVAAFNLESCPPSVGIGGRFTLEDRGSVARLWRSLLPLVLGWAFGTRRPPLSFKRLGGYVWPGTGKNAPAGFPESWRADRSQGCQSAVAALAQAEIAPESFQLTSDHNASRTFR
jgi:hypothetical protein